MESTAQYWRPVWEALEHHWRARRRAREGGPTARGHAPSRPSPIESRPQRTKEGLPGCGTLGETPGRTGTHLELRPRRRAAALAHRDVPQIPSHPQSRATPESAGGAARGSAHQGVEPRLGPAGQCAPPAAGPRGRGDRSGRARHAGYSALSRHAEQVCDALKRPRRCIRSTVDCSRSRWKSCG